MAGGEDLDEFAVCSQSVGIKVHVQSLKVTARSVVWASANLRPGLLLHCSAI